MLYCYNYISLLCSELSYCMCRELSYFAVIFLSMASEVTFEEMERREI